MRVTVEFPGQPPSFKLDAERSLRLGLGRAVGRVRSASIRGHEGDDARGRFACTLRLELHDGSALEAEVFEADAQASLQRAISRVCRATLRRLDGGRL